MLLGKVVHDGSFGRSSACRGVISISRVSSPLRTKAASSMMETVKWNQSTTRCLTDHLEKGAIEETQYWLVSAAGWLGTQWGPEPGQLWWMEVYVAKMVTLFMNPLCDDKSHWVRGGLVATEWVILSTIMVFHIALLLIKGLTSWQMKWGNGSTLIKFTSFTMFPTILMQLAL